MADYAVTIASNRVTVLSNQERAATGFTTKYKVLWSDINNASATTATDSVTMTLGTTPAKWFIDKALVAITTAFAGTTGTVVLIVGTTSSTAALISSTSVKTAATLNMTVGTPILTNLTATAAVSLAATFTNGTGGSLSTLSAGELDIYMAIRDQAKLP